MSAVSVFGDALDELGVWWPRGDGDALRAAGQVWTAVADNLAEMADVLDVAADVIAGAHRGDASRRFADAWAPWSGPEGHLRATVADCRRLAASLADFGTDVDVADRTLFALVEQALDELVRAMTPEAVEAWTQWLRESADGTRTRLDSGATRCTAALEACGERRPVAPSPTSPSSMLPSSTLPAELDPTRIEWVDPGTPLDRRALLDQPIDLVGGPPAPVPPAPPDPPVVAPSPDPTAPTGIRTEAGGTTIVVTGNSGPVTIEVNAAPVTPAWAPDPTPTPVPDAVPSLASLSSGGSSMPSIPSWSPAPLPPVEPLRPVEPLADVSVPTTVPVTIERAPMPVDAVAAVGTTAAVAAVAGKKASQGFMPFMPMGGGSGGNDDGPEPRRRARRPATS